MKRTQIYIEEGLFELLKKESKEKKIRISSIIREAIRDRYKATDTKADLVTSMCGIWSDNINPEIIESGKDEK